MSPAFFFRPALPLSALAVLLATGCTTAPTSVTAPVASPAVVTVVPTAASAPEAVPAALLVDLDYSGDQSALITLDAEINAAGTDPVKVAAIEQRLINLLRSPDGTVAARQAASQRLGFLFAQSGEPGSAALALLKAMLVGGRDADLARLALEPIPGAAVDAIFVEALALTEGRARIGVIQSLAVRRPVGVVSALGQLLKEPDAATAAAAATALGQIGGAAARAALNAVPTLTPAVVEARFSVALRLPAAEAVAALTDLQRDARLSDRQRATAVRGLLDLDPAGAVARTLEVLAGADRELKEVVLESLYASRAPGLGAALAASVGAWDAPTQRAVIEALGRRKETAASAAVLAATGHADADVRGAALTALGRIPGTPEVAAVLAKFAGGTDATDAKLARQSLAQLDGPGVSAIILAGAERGESVVRVAFIEQLALRNHTDGLPLLLSLRADPDAAVRAAAVAAFSEIAPPSELPVVLEWTIAATDANEQARALRALVTITLRDPDVARRGAAVYAAIERAPAPLALRLLPFIGRVGGAAGAEAAGKLSLYSDPAVANAALTALTRWADATPLPVLTMIAEKTGDTGLRARAVAGAVDLLERNRSDWSESLSVITGRLLAVATEGPPRQRLLANLARANDNTALGLADGMAADGGVGVAARMAAEIIRANQAGPAVIRTFNGVNGRIIMDGKTNTRWNTPMEGKEWIEIDFKVRRPVQRLTLDQTGKPTEFPEAYEIYVFDQPDVPGPIVAAGAGRNGRTIIELPAGTRGRYVMIKNIGTRPDGWWTISELLVD